MPLNQRNFNYFSYDSDDGNSYCVRGDTEWGNTAASGGSACAGEPAYGRASSRRHLRYATFQDPTTYRTFRGIVYTPAAYAALVIGSSTFDVTVADSATPVTYTLKSKTPEKVMSTVSGQQVLDHA